MTYYWNCSISDTDMTLGRVVLNNILNDTRDGAKVAALWYCANLHKSKMADIDAGWDRKCLLITV